MVVLLNGAFGVGKTTIARTLAGLLPGARIFNPEIVGVPLQRVLRLGGRQVEDFQNLSSWRALTVIGIRVGHMRSGVLIVPMAVSNPRYLAEIRSGAERFADPVLHFCLVAPIAVVRERLRRRGADERRNAWEYRRAAECCAVHGDAAFGVHVDATMSPQDIAAEIARRVPPPPASLRRG